MAKLIDSEGLKVVLQAIKAKLNSKLSIDTANAEDCIYGYYAGDGIVRAASNLFGNHDGLIFTDQESGDVDVTVDLTDPGIIGPLPVNKGGTGAEDPAIAAKNLKVLSLTGGYDLPEGSSVVTDNTQLVTSWASDNGFAETSGTTKGTLYKRSFSSVAAYMQDKLAVATTTSKGFMSAADKVKLDSIGNKCSYSFDSSTRVLTLSNTPTKYEVYYRKDTGVLGRLTVSNNEVTIPTDASDVLEVIIVDTTSVNKDIVII